MVLPGGLSGGASVPLPEQMLRTQPDDAVSSVASRDLLLTTLPPACMMLQRQSRCCAHSPKRRYAKSLSSISRWCTDVSYTAGIDVLEQRLLYEWSCVAIGLQLLCRCARADDGSGSRRGTGKFGSAGSSGELAQPL